MPRTKRQHYVPQLHLRHFLGEDPPDMLWTYDVFEGTWRQSTPENTGFESNFYAVQDQHGKYNDALEDWLSRSESKAALIYRNLIDGEIPIDQERADFSTFIASLYARSPAMLRTYGEVLGMSSQATMQFVASDPERFEASLKQFERDKGPIDPTVRAGLRDFILDPTRYTMEVDRRATLPALALSDKLQDLFFKMGWIVVDTGPHALISGDCPVARVVPSGSSHRIYGDGGFLNKGVAVTVPLTPSRCLVMGWTNDAAGLVTVTKEDARTYNRQRAYFAERFLYTNRRDGGIAALGRKYRDKGMKMVMDGVRQLAPVEVKRKLEPRR